MIEMKHYDEDISQNSFFNALQQKNPSIYRSAMKNNWLVCIPRTGTYDLSLCSDEDFLCHVLVPMNAPDVQLYTTLSDKKVTIEDRTIVTGAGFPEQQTIPVLFEETFYEGSNSRCRVACIEAPIRGEIVKNRSLVGHTAKPQRAIHVQNFEDSEIILFNDGGPRLREQVEKAIRSYNTSLDGLVPPYALRSLVDMTQALFASILLMVQRDLSMKKRKKEHPQLVDSLRVAVETYMMQKVCNKLFPRLCSAVAHKDAKLNKITRNLSQIELKDLGIQQSEFSENVMKARRILLDLPTYGSPLSKRICLKTAALALMQRPKALALAELPPLTTDDLLSLLIFTILRSDIPNWRANQIYMSDFHFSKTTDDEYGFYVSSLEAALKFLKMNCLLPGQRPAVNLGESPPIRGTVRSLSWVVPPSSTELDVVRLFKAIADRDCSAVKELLPESGEATGMPEQTLAAATDGDSAEQSAVGDKCHPLCTCERCTSHDSGLHVLTMPRRATVRSRDDQGLTALHVAAISGDPDILEYLLERGSVVDACDYRGLTPLHWACLKGVQSATLLLLTNSASVQHVDDDGNTPLHLAAANGHGECVKALLYQTESAATINLNAANSKGDTALHLAARWCYEDIVEMLILHGASTEVRNKKKQTPAMCTTSLSISQALTAAAQKACENSGFVLVDSYPPRSGSVSFMDGVLSVPAALSRKGSLLSSSADSALHRRSSIAGPVVSPAVRKLLKAVTDNDLNMVKYLLGWPDEESTPEINGDSNVPLCHPLCQCVACSTLQKVTTLPPDAVSINACDEHGKTCLHYAVESGPSHEGLLLALLRHSADVNAQMTSGGLTSLHLACQRPKPSPSVVQILVEHGSKVNARDHQGHTPLHYICCRNSAECARILLDGGANVNAVDNRGNAPLHCAVKADSVVLTRLLLQRGADTGVCNRDHIMPSQLAQCREVELLLQQQQQRLLQQQRRYSHVCDQHEELLPSPVSTVEQQTAAPLTQQPPVAGDRRLSAEPALLLPTSIAATSGGQLLILAPEWLG